VEGLGNIPKKVGLWGNCREDKKIFLSPCRKKSLSTGCFLKAGLISSACRVEFVNYGTHRTGVVLQY
jgi:hypothetical protein